MQLLAPTRHPRTSKEAVFLCVFLHGSSCILYHYRSGKDHFFLILYSITSTLFNKYLCKIAMKKAQLLMGDKGRVLVRKSGTEPKIRIMAESNNKILIENCIKIIKRSIK